MKDVVLLAPYFLPRRRVGSWRPFKFANHLRQFGWQPHVITIQDDSGSLTSKEQQLLQDISVHELTPLFDFTSQSDSQLSSITSGNDDSLKSLFQPALDWIDKQCPADTWLPFLWLKYRQVAKIVDDIKPHVLWSTGDPWSGHWLAKKLAKRFALPWVADFRDPWTLGKINLKQRSRFSSAIDKKLEARVIHHASEITFTSQTTEELYRHHYPADADKMKTIYNAFDQQLYNTPAKPSISFDGSKLNLLFFGTFRHLSPAKPFIDVLSNIDPEIAHDVLMHSFGPLSESDRSYASRQGVLSNFNQLEPIPAEEMLSVLPDADILWLSTAPEREHIIPAKLWDYLAAGRPIFSIAPNPEIRDILVYTNTGIYFSSDQQKHLIEHLHKCTKAKRRGEDLPLSFYPKKEAIRTFEATHATRTLAKLFDTLV